ncbi:MAG: ATP-binding cassette domain-containing protein, partial [Parabacteroides chartae]|nr:ATP-binding cassette domain-containing protein [Parabacteroides chartae]
AIVDTARFLKEQGKVPAAGTDYRQYVTDRFVSKGGGDAANLASSADYGGKPALADINLTLESGELLVVLGPSGCGKTTC